MISSCNRLETLLREADWQKATGDPEQYKKALNELGYCVHELYIAGNLARDAVQMLENQVDNLEQKKSNPKAAHEGE